jgi:hypothetical protein
MITDHYNPVDKTVNLSEAVYNQRNAAAAAVAAHECGQIGTIVHDGGSGNRLNQIGNFAGSKGAAVVYKGTNNSVVVNNYPGSIYNV